jgi:hypothetical protein
MKSTVCSRGLLILVAVLIASGSNRLSKLGHDMQTQVVVYLSPGEHFRYNLTLAMDTFSDGQLTNYNDLIRNMGSLGRFRDDNQLLDDMWYFNQPEFEEVFKYDNVNAAAVISVVNNHRSSFLSDKYLPRGLRTPDAIPQLRPFLLKFLNFRGDVSMHFDGNPQTGYFDDLKRISGYSRDGIVTAFFRDDGFPMLLSSVEESIHLLPYARMLIRSIGDRVEVWYADSRQPTILAEGNLFNVRLNLSPDLQHVAVSLSTASGICHSFLFSTSYKRTTSVTEISDILYKILSTDTYGAGHNELNRYTDTLVMRDAGLVADMQYHLRLARRTGGLQFVPQFPQQVLLKAIIASIDKPVLLLPLVKEFLSGRSHSGSSLRTIILGTVAALVDLRYSIDTAWLPCSSGVASHPPPSQGHKPDWLNGIRCD